MSFAQAFGRVYAAPENAGLVARERRQNRPDGVLRAVSTRP
jgi:hypothetical protein